MTEQEQIGSQRAAPKSVAAINAEINQIARAVENPNMDAIKTLAEAEREHIESVLDKFGGNRTRAAKALGISVRTLQRRLNAYAATDGVRQDFQSKTV